MRARQVPTEWPLVALALALTGFGTLMVYSAGQTDVPSFVETLWRSQLVWAALGVSVAYATTRTSVRFLHSRVRTPCAMRHCRSV